MRRESHDVVNAPQDAGTARTGAQAALVRSVLCMTQTRSRVKVIVVSLSKKDRKGGVVHTHTRTRTHTRLRTHTRTHIHTRTRTHAHTNTHTHAHTQVICSVRAPSSISTVASHLQQHQGLVAEHTLTRPCSITKHGLI